MKEVIVTAQKGQPVKTAIHDVPIPTPGPDEVLIKVAATDSNPKDWKHPQGLNRPHNSGDDIAGTITQVGTSVTEFHPDERVAAFHRMAGPHGSYAEYAIAPAITTFALPPNISFEEGATLPLTAMTAALGLFQNLRLPTPWAPVRETERGSFPLLIYGGASAVGAFALKFAKMSGLGPIVTVVGESGEFVRSLNAADHFVDYRKGNVVGDIRKALGKAKLKYAFDVTCAHESWVHICEVLDRTEGGSYIDMLDPPDEYSWPEGVVLTRTFVATAYGEAHEMRSEKEALQDRDFAYMFYRYMSLLLKEGRLSGHPYEVIPGGLTGVQEGIQRLHDHKVHGKKLVYRIADTPGL